MEVVELPTPSIPTTVEPRIEDTPLIQEKVPQLVVPSMQIEEDGLDGGAQEHYHQQPVQQVNETPLDFETTTSSLSTSDVQEAPALFEVESSPSIPVEKKVSALSLSSIRARKEMESSLEKKVVNPDDLPKEPFTADQFMTEWNKYAEKLARSGFMLMSSLMGMVPPVIQGTSVSLEMPNEGSKLSFDENKFDLVNYLRKKLNNFDLEIEITVNEEVKIQKRVLDKEDKLVRFIELNPAMQYMKEIFDLEFKY